MRPEAGPLLPPSRSRGQRLLVAIALAVGLAGPAGAFEIQLPERYPLRGEATGVRVVSGAGEALPAGAVLRVVYRPNSQTSTEETLPLSPDGTVTWSPRDAGIVELAALDPAVEGASPFALRLVAVRFGGFPASGLAVMLVAGLLLFGGVVVSFWFLLSGTPPDEVVVEPPST